MMPEQPAYLQAAVDISHLGARVSDEHVLLEAVADCLQRNLGLVAVQVYVVGASGQLGHLRHHAGEGDRAAIVKSPDVAVGSDSPLGEVLSGEVRRVMGDLVSLPRGAAPPGAKQAVGMPLIVEGRTLGALVFYEGGSNSGMEVNYYAFLTDIVALSLETVRLRAQHPRREPSQQDALPYESAPSGVSRPASARFGDPPSRGSRADRTVPINLRGAVVGSMTFHENPERTLEEDEVVLIERVAEQVGRAIEQMSLRHDAAQAAGREEMISEIAVELERATTVDDLLQTAATAVRRALGDVEVTARLVPGTLAVPEDGAGQTSSGERV